MKQNRNYLLLIPILFVIFLSFLSVSCTHESDIISELDTVCFEGQVFPIINSTCGTSGCHSGTGDNREFDASNYESIVRAVEPGDAKNSLLYKVITNIYSDDFMPPNKPLSLNDRTLIQLWIAQGAKNTKCPEFKDITRLIDTTIVPIKDTICFAQDVQPILNSSCATTNCHDDLSHKGGYIFTTYENITSNNDAVRPFLPDESKIYRVLNKTGEDRMPPPPFNALTNEHKEIIRRWIAEGGLDSDCTSSTCDTLDPISFSQQIFPVINRSCVGCHGSSNSNGGIVLESYTDIKNVANTLRNSTSLLLGVIRRESGFSPMPPTGTIDDCTIRQFELWVEQGLANN